MGFILIEVLSPQLLKQTNKKNLQAAKYSDAPQLDKGLTSHILLHAVSAYNSLLQLAILLPYCGIDIHFPIVN